jgi:outer membrane immunogenic protein
MHLRTSARIVLCILLLAGTGLAQAQSTHGPSGDLAVTFISQRSLKADTGQNFWMEGGSAELGFNLLHGLGLAVGYTGTHTNSIGSSGVPLTLSVIALGPRYRWHADHRLSVYGESLFGYANGSDSAFPAASGSVSTASSFAFQLNGGLDYRLSPRVAVRALDMGYLRTTLPNATDNVQNTIRLGAGLVFRFGI